eukprot:c5156_g1_i1 orf=22-1998(-)
MMRAVKCTHLRIRVKATKVAKSTDSCDDTVAEHGDSKAAITAVCGILTRNPWCAETEEALMKCSFSINAQIVVKAIKSVPAQVALHFFHWLKSQGFQHDFSTYHAAIDVLGESRCFNEMRLLVAEMRESHCTMRAMLYRDVIYWCACAGNVTEAMSYWEDMKKDEIRPSVALWTALIDVHAKAKKYDTMVILYSDMLQSGLSPNSRTLSIFVDHLVELGDLNAANAIVVEMHTLDMFPSMSSYARLMAAHARAGSVVVLKRMAKDLRYVCNKPGHAFWNVVKALCQEGLEEQALLLGREVWPELSQQEIMEKAGRCFELKDELQACSGAFVADGNVDHNSVETGTCMGCTQAVSHVRLEKILKSWNSSTISYLRGAKIEWSDEVIYDLLSRRIQKPHIAWNLFCWLEKEGVQHNIFNQITMLRILSRNKLFSFLVLLLTEIQKKGMMLPIIIFNFIIADFGRAENASAVSWVFNRLERFGLEPDQGSYTALMDAYSRANLHEEALILLERMHKAGYTLEASSFTLLIDMLMLVGKADKAQLVFQRFLDSGGKPSAECFTALVKAHCWSGNAELALQTYRNMMQAGIAPLLDTLWSMAWVYLQISNLEKVKECLILPQESLSPQEKKLSLHRDSLMSVKTVLVKSFNQERSISLHESQF